MALLRNKWIIVSMFLACWSLTMTLLAGYYWFKFSDVQNRIGEGLISVGLGVDYGNGTREWHNNTNAFAGETLFDITKQVSNVTYDVSSFGTMITGINNVTAEGSYGWTYWVLNSTTQSWSIVFEGVDAHMVANEETYMWYYTNEFNPPA
jgi:hypothetical protein